jgi:UDP-2,4-diacetamido-2,4,6-trideoxy-beta-L-altropyranose hydrolase
MLNILLKKSNMYDIIIRADGNSKIGMGHVFRTLNLSFILNQKNYRILFLTTNTLVRSLIKKEGFECKLLPSKILDQKKFLTNFYSDIIILDKKNESTTIINQLKKISKVFFAIDYIGNNKHLVPFGVNILYPKSGSQKNFSGLKYAILNKNFKKFKKINKSVNSIIILQGGSDTDCFIPKIITALDESQHSFKITAIVGPSFTCWSELKIAQKNCNRSLNILKNISDMYNEMPKHDVAITAGGMTALELCKCGIPCLFLGSEKQEEETATLLEKYGFGLNLRFSKKFPKNQLLVQINYLIKNYNLRKSMNKTASKLIDGNGSIRVADLIMNNKNLN